MYGLTHRIDSDAAPKGDVVEPSPLARISSLGAPATVMVIDRDPLNLAMVRRAVADHYHVVVARVDDAVRVSRRVYLGGGLRHRLAA